MRCFARTTVALLFVCSAMCSTVAADPLTFPGGVPAYQPGDNNYTGDMLVDDNTDTVYSVARDNGDLIGIILPTLTGTSAVGGVAEFRSVSSFAQPTVTFELSPPPIANYATDLTAVFTQIQPGTPTLTAGTASPSGDYYSFDSNGQVKFNVNYSGGSYAIYSDTNVSDYDHNPLISEDGFDPTQSASSGNVFASGPAMNTEDGLLWLEGDISNTTSSIVFQGVDTNGDSNYDEAYMTVAITTMDLPATGGHLVDEGLLGQTPFVTANLDSRLSALGPSGFLPDGTLSGGLYGPASELGAGGANISGFDLADSPNLTVEVVPEPTTLLILGAGVAGLVCSRKRKS